MKTTGHLDPVPTYANWLASLKAVIHRAQQRAALAVNHELVALYWRIGHDILLRQATKGWGAKVIDRLSVDLRDAFPEMKGFSPRNLVYMRTFADVWSQKEITQAPLAQLPWYHQVTLLDKLSTKDERLAYARLAVQHGWSRNVLVHHIALGTADRIGKAPNNFRTCLPKPQSDLAVASLKDPYKFDFLTLGKDAAEREIENALVSRMTDFLLELGTGFAFVGKQVHLQVGKEDFFIDLLFYHLRLRRYVVIELKAGTFKPEHLGQLGFYMTAVDHQLREKADRPTIGLLLCQSKDRLVAEYSMEHCHRPLGVSSYEMGRQIPPELKAALPSVKQIEAGLSRG